MDWPKGGFPLPQQTPIRQSQSLNQHRVRTIVLRHARQRKNFLLQVFVLRQKCLQRPLFPTLVPDSPGRGNLIKFTHKRKQSAALSTSLPSQVVDTPGPIARWAV